MKNGNKGRGEPRKTFTSLIQKTPKHGKVKKCSTCKKTGHNSRTCGKQSNTLVEKVPKPTPIQHKKSSKTKQLKRPTPHLPQLQKSITNEESYTLEDLQVLWELTSGRKDLNDGYVPSRQRNLSRRLRNLSNAEVLFNFVNDAHLADPNIPVKVWEKFFENFNEYELEEFLTLYTHEPYPEHEKYRELTIHLSPMNDTELPEKFFHALANHESIIVATVLADKKGLPKSVQKEMAQRGNFHLLNSLISYRNLNEEVFYIIAEVTQKMRKLIYENLQPNSEKLELKHQIEHVETVLLLRKDTPPEVVKSLTQRQKIVIPYRTTTTTEDK